MHAYNVGRSPRDHVHASLRDPGDWPAYPIAMCRICVALAMKNTTWNEVMSAVLTAESLSASSEIFAVLEGLPNDFPRMYILPSDPQNTMGLMQLVTKRGVIIHPSRSTTSSASAPCTVHLNRRIGHPNNRILVQVRRRLGAAPDVLHAAQNLKCMVCNQRASKTSLKKASVCFPALRGVSAVSSGGFYRTDPRDQKVCNGTIAIGDSTRLTAAMLYENLEDGSSRRSSEMLGFLY